MKYEMDFKEDYLRCWTCGRDIIAHDECAYLIEWQVGFAKEIICQSCLDQLTDNDKDIKILATITRKKRIQLGLGIYEE